MAGRSWRSARGSCTCSHVRPSIGALAFSDHPDLIGGNEQESRFFVDEIAYAPGGSDPIDASSFVGDPLYWRAPARPPAVPILSPPPSFCLSAPAPPSIPWPG